MSASLVQRGVVLDTGSCFTKVGYSGEEAPRSIFHSCVGATRRGGVDATLLQYPSDIVAGDAAYRNRGLFHLCHPIQHAELVDPHTFEQLLFYTLYHELRVPPEESAVLMLEPVNVSRQQREKVAEAMFESLNVPLLALLNTSSATLYSTGQTSGVVIDSGAGKTMINAVTHGYPLAFAMQLSHMAGDYLTDQLFANLRAKGYPFSTRADWHLAEQIKEHRCRAALDLPQELSALMGRDDMPSSNAYDLPDKERVFLFENEVTIAECLFDVGMARAMRRQDDKCSENEKDGAKAVTPQRGGSLSLSATATTANHTAQEAQSKSLTTYGFVASGRNAAALRDVDASLRPIDTTGYAAPNPSCGTPLYGWAEAVSAIIAASPAHLRTELYGSVVLGGGTTLMRDVDRRLQQELVRQVTQQRPVEQLLGAWSTEQPVRSMETLEKLRKSNLTSSSLLTAGSPVCAMDASMIRVIAHASRHYAAWIGGSIWSSLSVYPQSGISVAEYHECGPQAVHQYAL